MLSLPSRPPAALVRLRLWMRKSLSARIVLLFLGLLLAVQALSFLAIRESIEDNARAAIAADLEVGERLLKRLLEQNAHKLAEGATLLAADYGFRSAVASGDKATINSVLEVVNPTGNASALTVTPLAGGTRPVGASLVIQRLS